MGNSKKKFTNQFFKSLDQIRDFIANSYIIIRIDLTLNFKKISGNQKSNYFLGALYQLQIFCSPNICLNELVRLRRKLQL